MKHRREILAIALPAIISNLTTPILGLVDVAITGHLESPVYLAAIAVGGSMFNMIYWLFGFLRMGSSGMTAQAYGATDRSGAAAVLYRSLLIGITAGLIMIALNRPLGEFVLGFMDADGATSAMAARYFGICIWGAPAVLLSYGLAGWFIGMQDSRSAMWMSIITNIVNVAVSLILVIGLGMKIEGVATGTLTAQWCGALYGIARVYFHFRPVRVPFSRICEGRELKSFFKVNSDIFLRTCCLVAVTLWFTHAGAMQSTEILAANALLLQLFMLFSYFMDGFAYSGEALAGKYFGRKDQNSLRSLVNSLMKTGLICAIAFGALYLAGGELFLDLLSDDKKVVATATTYLPWAVAIPLCGFMAFMWDGIFIGLVATRAMLASMAASLIVFFGLWLSLEGKLGNHALWLAFDAYLAVRGLVLLFIYRSRYQDCGKRG